ncbi:transglutaminaseTgpA domain-containing protein [Salinilacihabitans rarus]|uniref:transglutaminaseTgpA domain-containing protein n=1 Tax=Salinilacihabitans rarus TaxID=2961596 RepID=UPI0020C8D9A4|nr:transglutaminaseTgpA domain-containing protein [Salinilacihabitans rarus]
MSTRTRSWTVSTSLDGVVGPRAFRALALAAVAILLASVVSVLLEVTRVVGGSQALISLVALAVAVATVLARTIRPRSATALATAAALVGFAYYFEAAGVGIGTALSATDQLLSDTIALATGLPLDRMVEAGVWTLGFAPGPAFLSWYLAIRRRYALAVVPGGAALLFLVLTGDAALGPTVIGTVGGVAAVGFGELERREGSIAQADLLALLFAATVVLSLSVTLVPGGAAQPTILVSDDDAGDGTLEGSIDAAPDRSAIAGDVELTPEVRFTIRSERESYWRTGVYDRFTGDAWVRTGQAAPYADGRLDEPPGEYETVRQTVTVEEGVETMPAAPQPVAIEGEITGNTEVTTHGQVRPASPLIRGDTYNVESAVVDARPAELRAAGTDYPEEVESRYLQTPETTSGEFEAATAGVVDGADTPYDKAATIERHLRTSNGYSLSVDRPDGNVAEAFLFEMEEGYCVYFATTMVQMLRAEGVPARYVTGYTSGQQVDDGTWVVRGLDAHAWVEVYFPDHGWVAFDPTPADTRNEVHADRLEDAREAGEENVDTEESEGVPVDGPGASDDEFGTDEIDGTGPTLRPDEDVDPRNTSPGEGTDGPTIPREDPLSGDPDAGGGAPGDADDGGETTPTPADAVVAFALVVGLAAGVHRAGVTALVGREARLYWQGFRGDPEADVERAYRRLELLLERRYRPRRESESVRQYLRTLSRYRSFDDEAVRVGRLYERARYGDGVDREAADEAIATVDALVRSRLPAVGRFWRRSS